MGKGYETFTPSPGAPHSPKSSCVHQPGLSPNSIIYGGFIPSAWLINSTAIGNWFNLQPVSPPLKDKGGTESSSPWITWLVLFSRGMSLTYVSYYSLTVELGIPYPLFCAEYNVYNRIGVYLIITITRAEPTSNVYGIITSCLYIVSGVVLITAPRE